MVKKILITGSSGHVGSHVVEHVLKNTDWDIIGLDRLDYASSGYDRLRNIEAYDNNRVTLFATDLQEPLQEGLKKEIGKVDYIIHMAAGSHVDNSITNPRPFILNNVKNTISMLDYAREVNPKKFIYFSTDEVYSTVDEKTGYLYKEGDRFNPGNPYSASKASAECICMAYANTYKLPIQITNGMNILGERQHPEKYLPKIINCILNGEKLEIHANAEKTQAGKRHYIHARNVGDALLFILNNVDESLHHIDASKGKFNIVGEKQLDNLQLAQIVEKAVQKHYPDKKLIYELVDFHSERPGHDLIYGLNGDKMKNLGWEPPKTIEESIQKIVDWSLQKENARWLK